MSHSTLSDFLSELQDDGELRRVHVEVDPVLEAAEIVDRLCKLPGGGPAVLFERVRGSNMPLVVNLLGSQQRICRALGVKAFDQVSKRAAGSFKAENASGWLQRLKLAPPKSDAPPTAPQTIKTGPCQQVVKIGRDVDLEEFPALRQWPGDAARFLTGGQVFSKLPSSLERSLETFPLQILGRNTLGVHWNLHHAAFQSLAEHRARGTQAPLAVSFGGPPVLHFLTAAPVPPKVDKLTYGGALCGRPLELVKCRQIDLEVPAQAEIVLEGYIDPTQPLEPGGPFGLATGFYSAPEEVAVFHVTAVTHRSNPLLTASLAGKPPMEDFWISQAHEALLLPWIQLAAPEVVDFHVPRSGAQGNLCFVSIRKTYPQQARKTMQAIWSLERTMFSKIVVVVDEHVDIRDRDQVWFYVGANVHPGRDVAFHEGPAAPADHAAPVRGIGHKMGIDATRKLPEEGHARDWPAELAMSGEIKELVSGRWAEYKLGLDPGETW